MRHPLVCVFAILLSACVPLLVEHYEPQGEVGKNVPLPRCGGPDRSWQFRFSKVSLEVYPWGRSLGLLAYIPEGHTMQLESTGVVVQYDLAADPVRLDIGEWRVSDAVGDETTLGAMERLEGKSGRWLGLPMTRTFSTELPLPPDAGAHDFAVRLPAVVVDGERQLLPEVRFVRQRGWFIAPINC